MMSVEASSMEYELPKGNLERRVEGMLNGVWLVLSGQVETYLIDPQDDLGTTHYNKGVLINIDNAPAVGANILNKYSGIFPQE